jgi:hypothetical protein
MLSFVRKVALWLRRRNGQRLYPGEIHITSPLGHDVEREQHSGVHQNAESDFRQG